MKQKFPLHYASRILFVLLTAAGLFQLAVIAGFVPIEMVWGGRLNTTAERTTMTLVSLFIIMGMITVVAMRMGMFGYRLERSGRFGAWVMVALFALNTLGNLAALDVREMLLFTPVTLLLCGLSLRLALE